MADYRIGDEVYIHGIIDEIRKDTVIIKNAGGYFGTISDEIIPSAQPEPCEDAVSRQAVYNVLDKMPVRGFKKDGETIHGLISLSQVYLAIIDLPSVQPLVIHCTDCEGWHERQSILGSAISQLPSAQHELNLDEWCTDCKEYDHERNCCPRWNRVIRQTLKDMKEEQPEIIRCKDCRYYQDNNGGYPHMNCKWDANETPDEDDFCSGAERKDT